MKSWIFRIVAIAFMVGGALYIANNRFNRVHWTTITMTFTKGTQGEIDELYKEILQSNPRMSIVRDKPKIPSELRLIIQSDTWDESYRYQNALSSSAQRLARARKLAFNSSLSTDSGIPLGLKDKRYLFLGSIAIAVTGFAMLLLSTPAFGGGKTR